MTVAAAASAAAPPLLLLEAEVAGCGRRCWAAASGAGARCVQASCEGWGELMWLCKSSNLGSRAGPVSGYECGCLSRGAGACKEQPAAACRPAAPDHSDSCRSPAAPNIEKRDGSCESNAEVRGTRPGSELEVSALGQRTLPACKCHPDAPICLPGPAGWPVAAHPPARRTGRPAH